MDVPGPSVEGLPTCDSLRIVTIHRVTDQKQKSVHPSIRDISDLVKLYPDRFDTIGNLRKAAKLHLKEDTKPSLTQQGSKAFTSRINIKVSWKRWFHKVSSNVLKGTIISAAPSQTLLRKMDPLEFD